MNNRDLHMIIIADVNNEASREIMGHLTDDPNIQQTVITPDLVRNILPGIRATPAIGVLLWATDLQGLATDVDSFAAYIKGEEDIKAALDTLGISLQKEA